MTDFNSNPDPLKATTDGDTGPGGATGLGGTGGVDLTSIREDMEVVGSDGRHVGEIDHFREGRLKLKKNDSEAQDGQHHYLPLEWVAKVDSNANRVMLSLDKDEATSRWEPAG